MNDEVDKRDVDKSPSVKGRSGSEAKDRTNVGSALRAVYQDAIGEDVPDEFLALLNKLK